MASDACAKGALCALVLHVIQLHVTYAWICCPCPLPQGMMGAYGPPYMPMQGPHEGLLSVAQMSPHPAGGPHLPPHHLQQGMPGYPGMLHQGKGHSPSHESHVLSHIQSCLSCWRGLPGPQVAAPAVLSEHSKPCGFQQAVVKCLLVF